MWRLWPNSLLPFHPVWLFIPVQSEYKTLPNLAVVQRKTWYQANENLALDVFVLVMRSDGSIKLLFSGSPSVLWSATMRGSLVVTAGRGSPEHSSAARNWRGCMELGANIVCTGPLLISWRWLVLVTESPVAYGKGQLICSATVKSLIPILCCPCILHSHLPQYKEGVNISF